MDDGSALVERTRELLAAHDRAIPTMELSLALDISAQLATRLLVQIEQHPQHRSLLETLASVDRLDESSEHRVVNAKGWDDAVNYLVSTGRDPIEARHAVDWFILEMAIHDWLATERVHRAITELASLTGTEPADVLREGAAATFRRLIASGRLDRIRVTRAFVVAASLGFQDAWILADALETEGRRDALVAAGERIDAGSADAAAAILIDRLGLLPLVAESVSQILAAAFASTPSR